jgi:mono/diheme cytochrome c family protein
MKVNVRALVATAGLALGFGVLVAGQAPQNPDTYTAEQATAGRTAYDRSCASCHLDSLQGSAEAPPLAGVDFMRVWGRRATRELLEVIKTSMPFGDPGSLRDETYKEIVAFLLQANEVAPGSQPFTGAGETRIGELPRSSDPGKEPAAPPR